MNIINKQNENEDGSWPTSKSMLANWVRGNVVIDRAILLTFASSEMLTNLKGEGVYDWSESKKGVEIKSMCAFIDQKSSSQLFI
jgi:hypothetical protein